MRADAGSNINTSINSEKYFKPTVRPEYAVQNMTGTWSGTRTDLERKGVTFKSTYVEDTLGNPSGGRTQGARYDHSMGWDINFDLEKFVGLIGTQFHISGLWRAGQSLSSATIGNDFVVSSIYGSEQFRFYNLYLEQSLCDDRVNLRIGRLGAGDDFATSEIYWNFVTNAIDGNPISIPKNVFFPCYPAAVWGARMRCDITDNIYTTTGIYNGDPGVPRMSMYGLDFSLRLKRGIIFAQEVAYTPNVYRGCPTGKGLPGHYKVGAFYHGGTFRDYSTDVNGTSTSISGLPAKKIIGNYGIYFHADQMIYKKKGTDCDEGLTPFVVVTLAPDNINEFPFFIDGGFIFKGLVPTRNHDITSVGFAYGKYSDSLRANERDNAEYNGSTFPIQSYELIFDFSYKLEITAWMFLQPDIQYIVNPAGGHDIDNALVVGSRFGLTF